MLKSKKLLPSYPDGVVAIYREKDRETDFGAKRNPRTIKDMDIVVKLDFEEKSCREQDFLFAEQQGFTLSRKVKTPYFGKVDSDCRAVISNALYGISRIDRSKSEMYLYMSSVGELEVAK